MKKFLNTAESDASCSVTVDPTGGQGQVITPGVGGTDPSVGGLLTITQNQKTTSVFDWVERLALGRHGAALGHRDVFADGDEGVACVALEAAVAEGSVAAP